MFLEKLFSNTFGLIWLAIFVVAAFVLIIWMFAKKENVSEYSEVKEVEPVSEQVEEKEIVETKEEVVIEQKEEAVNKDYEILESEDGFFRVRKVGSDRTLRKFSTRIEAENFIEKRGLKND